MSNKIDGVYFDASKMGDPSESYVCWLDVMGSQQHLRRSTNQAANYIFKLHAAIIKSIENFKLRIGSDIIIYPVMDGAFLVTEDWPVLKDVLSDIMFNLATLFCKERDEHRFLARGGIAFGRLFHGSKLECDASYDLNKHPEIRNSIVIGLAVLSAYAAESKAPPFGFAIDDSAKMFAPPGKNPLSGNWWPWFDRRDPEDYIRELAHHLNEYYQFLSRNANNLDYKPERQRVHKAMIEEYFPQPE